MTYLSTIYTLGWFIAFLAFFREFLPDEPWAGVLVGIVGATLWPFMIPGMVVIAIVMFVERQSWHSS